MKYSSVALACMCAFFSAAQVKAEETAAAILAKSSAQYLKLRTYRSEGVVTMDYEVNGEKTYLETGFALKMKKPSRYLAVWVSEMSPGALQIGAVWNSSGEPFLYVGTKNRFYKTPTDGLAVGVAEQMNFGVTHAVPNLFFEASGSQMNLKGYPFSRLKNPRVEKSELIGGEDCYVVGSETMISKREAYWISKSRSVILKYERDLAQPDGDDQVPPMTDAAAAHAAEGMGLAPTEANLKKIKESAKKTRELIMSAKVKGILVETHSKVDSPEISDQELNFKLPPDSALRTSLLD